MNVIYNESCSKCVGLSGVLSEAGVDWNALKYMEGELSNDVLDTIFDLYDGYYSDLVRRSEKAWIDSGINIESISIADLKFFILENPIVLQRPIVIRDGKAVIARSSEKLRELLAG